VETVKAIEQNLVKALDAERTSGAVTEAMKRFWESAKGLDERQIQAFAHRWSNASKSNLKKLTQLSPSQLKSYAKDIAGKVDLDPKVLKQIIYREGDRAGTAILKTLNDIDASLAKTGKVSRTLLNKMKSQAGGLDPKQARAFYDLLKNQAKDELGAAAKLKTSFFKDNVGTMVEGVFVLSDAFDIYYSDDEPDVKAIKATGKIIDYGVGTGAGAASTSLGGGLGPGLVIAFTANRLSTLYMEIAMLEKERAAAASIEEDGRIYNSILVRRQFVKINRMITSGELANARFRLIKLERFLTSPDHGVDNLEMLFKLQNELAQKVENAERALRINEILNQARHPFQRALTHYHKGVELPTALANARDALGILKEYQNQYPEIKERIPRVNQLILAINNKIASAPPLKITEIEGPDRVYTSQVIDYLISVEGGLPYYTSASDITSNLSPDVVTMYWEAPDESKELTVVFSIQDCSGQRTSIKKNIEVVARDEDMVAANGDCTQRTYQVSFKNNTETADFKLYTMDQIVDIAEGINGKPVTDAYKYDLARMVHNTYLSITDNTMNKEILRRVPNLSETCYKKIIDGSLSIMYHGTYSNSKTGEVLQFRDGKRIRVIREADEEEPKGSGNPFGGYTGKSGS